MSPPRSPRSTPARWSLPQIETEEGLGNVEAIAAVPAIDALWIGHFDLTNFMGIPGAFQHPDYLAAVKRVVAACEAHGKAAAFLATDDAWAREYQAHGFRLFAYGIDQAMLQRRCGAASTSCDGIAEAPTHGSDHSAWASRATSSTRAASPRSATRRSRCSNGRAGLDWEYLPEMVPRRSTPTMPRATTRSTSTWRARLPPRSSRVRIAACAWSPGTASATTRSTCRR